MFISSEVKWGSAHLHERDPGLGKPAKYIPWCNTEFFLRDWGKTRGRYRHYRVYLPAPLKVWRMDLNHVCSAEWHKQQEKCKTLCAGEHIPYWRCTIQSSRLHVTIRIVVLSCIYSYSTWWTFISYHCSCPLLDDWFYIHFIRVCIIFVLLVTFGEWFWRMHLPSKPNQFTVKTGKHKQQENNCTL